MEKVQKNRKMILAILVLAVIFATITIVISIKSARNNTTSNGSSSNTTTNQTADNFIVTEGTNKLNTSTQVTADKKVGNILIQNSKIEYDQIKGSTLTAKVTNDSVVKDNMKLKVKFIANDGSTISETVALVGKADANQVKYISAGTTIDVTNAKDVVYEIVE
jgi:cytochrome c-type biogenesis protein CcmE